MTSQSWEAKAQVARDILEKSIQKQWLLPAEKLPSPDRLNVIDIPRECGLLGEEELEMTETDATGLVGKMAKGIWTAEAVLTAFLKRATIGHQLVSQTSQLICDDIDII
jgi:amidase